MFSTSPDRWVTFSYVSRPCYAALTASLKLGSPLPTLSASLMPFAEDVVLSLPGRFPSVSYGPCSSRVLALRALHIVHNCARLAPVRFALFVLTDYEASRVSVFGALHDRAFYTVHTFLCPVFGVFGVPGNLTKCPLSWGSLFLVTAFLLSLNHGFK